MRSKGTETKESRRADRVVTTNRRANYDYFIDEIIETGIVLQGTEIKAIRDGKISISEAYARIQGDELWLIGANISPYSHGSYTNHEPDRPRKLLVHKKQIRELRAEIEQKGKTIPYSRHPTPAFSVTSVKRRFPGPFRSLRNSRLVTDRLPAGLPSSSPPCTRNTSRSPSLS
jgi:SsrA-binding protein